MVEFGQADDYRPRVADSIITESLATFGAVVIQGPRAVGKTTTGLIHAASSIRLDSSPQLANLAQVSPDDILRGTTPRLIDEWQLAPALWNAVRHEVDQRRARGQFILAGSATPPDDVTRHSGAGRIGRVTLRPMCLEESGDSTATVPFSSLFEPDVEAGMIAGFGGPTVSDYARLIVRGGWPTLVDDPTISPTRYLDAYLDDVAGVDLPGADFRVQPLRMRALLRALARNTASEAAATRLGNEADLPDKNADARGVSAQSVRKYLDALTRVFVIEELPAWSTPLRSNIRLRTQPKWHFCDPSLGAAALGTSPQSLLGDLNTFGLFFESLVVRDLRVYAHAVGGSVFHYRDSSNLEVDAIVELRDGRWAAVEVKMGGDRELDAAAARLHALAAKVSVARRSTLASLNVITAGNTSYVRPDRVNVIALGHLRAGPTSHSRDTPTE
jgi:predicted AAA+ superfamily ATPase